MFLIDARAGLVSADEMFADLVRGSGKPIILAANKCEGRAAEPGIYEAYALGFGEPLPISAEHGTGIGELSEAIQIAYQKTSGEAGPRGDDLDVQGEARQKRKARTLCASPSSAGRMSASPPWSMRSSARTA